MLLINLADSLFADLIARDSYHPLREWHTHVWTRASSVKLPIQRKEIHHGFTAHAYNLTFYHQAPFKLGEILLSFFFKIFEFQIWRTFSHTYYHFANKRKKLVFLDSYMLFKFSSRVIQDKAITSKDRRAPKENKEDK